MKVLKATLAFVMGLVLGIILLVLAIGGTVVALGTTRTVGEIQSAVTDSEIISPDSELFGQSVLEAVQKALKDYQNFDDITLKLLYERYGIKLLNGISGLDFTQKSFYDTPLTSIINDLSLLLNDIYLSDIEAIADMDFSKYNLPILDENMNVGITKAIDNIMALVNDDLSIRMLKTKLNLDIGADGNGILSALQDVNLKNIGGLIDVLPIDVLLDADTDTFLPKGVLQVYVNVEGTSEEWEEVSEADLSNPDYAPALGIETYISGGMGGDDNKLVQKELRYIKKEDGEPYVDNSCYNEGWTCPEGAKVLRHRLYKPFDGDGSEGGKYFVLGYGNHLAEFSNDTNKFTLTFKDFISLDDIFTSGSGDALAKTLVKGGKLDLSGIKIYYLGKAAEGEEDAPKKYVESGEYSILEKTMEKNNLLRLPDAPTVDEEGNEVAPKHDYVEGRDRYLRVHLGEASPLLQYLNFLTIGDVRSDTDSILKNIRIGDIIDTDAEGTADILKALKDSTLDSIGSDINTIPFGSMFENDSDNSLLNAIKDFTLENIDEKIDTLKLGDILSEENKDNTLINALDARGCTIGNMGNALDSLTVGELLEIEYDVYEADEDKSTGTHYVKMPIYVKINDDILDLEQTDPESFERVFKNVYGEDVVRGDYTAADEATGAPETFVENGDGEYIRTYYYLYQDESYFEEHPEVVPYEKQLPASETALAVQSLARRGVPALEMGNYINKLSIGELMTVDKDSSQLFKTLARRGSTMDTIANDVNTLEVADLIEITDESSKIMQSLRDRHCTIDDMDTITDELTLDEILDITQDTYIPDDSGVYVRLTDPKGYVIYHDNPEHSDDWLTKYVKVENTDASGYDYVPYDPAKHEGMTVYVHSTYYTLYNPAVHTSPNIKNAEGEDVQLQPKSDDGSDKVQLFTKREYDASEDPTGENEPSSKILQRFAGSTMGDFSDAFNDIMLSDVLDIDPDIYAAVQQSEIEGKTELFKYIKDKRVYSVASEADIAKAKEGEETLYEITHNGTSTAILKKLAYVKVNDMASALDTVMKDMKLSEIIDIHEYDAINGLTEVEVKDSSGHVGVKEGDSAKYSGEDKRYFIPWDGQAKIGDRPIVYVYESTGKYIARNKFYYPINEGVESDVNKYLGTPTEVYFKYEQYKGNLVGDLLKVQSGNAYVKKDDVYVQNIALATYYATKSDWTNLFYREFCLSNEGVKLEKQPKKYNSIPGDYNDKIYVEILGNKTKYNPENPSHCDLQKYVLLEGGSYIVPLDEDGYEYSEGSDVRIGAQYARDVMILQADLKTAQQAAEANKYDTYGDKYKKVYVYIESTNQYEEYDESKEDHNQEGTQYYIMEIGYIAQYGEVFYESREASGKCYTALPTFYSVGTVEREHSSKILTLLGNRTIDDMNGAIESATIGDFMDVTPGTIFDDEAIRKSTLNKLGTTLASELSNMTIGKLLEWGSITSMDASVRNILNDVTLTAFFGALKYDIENGSITLDMATLYGVNG